MFLCRLLFDTISLNFWKGMKILLCCTIKKFGSFHRYLFNS